MAVIRTESTDRVLCELCSELCTTLALAKENEADLTLSSPPPLKFIKFRAEDNAQPCCTLGAVLAQRFQMLKEQEARKPRKDSQKSVPPESPAWFPFIPSAESKKFRQTERDEFVILSACYVQGFDFLRDPVYEWGLCELEIKQHQAAINHIPYRKCRSVRLEVEFRDRAPVLASWLQECLACHPCDKLIGSLKQDKPGRLLKLESMDSDSSSTVKVVCTNQWSGCELPHYAALSHCWGKSPPSLKLTIDTIDHLTLSGVSVTDLPATFGDAVKVTWALGLQYLWIDTLCILQHGDDGADWHIEAPKMGGIFHLAQVTISAVSARSADDGCRLSTRQAPRYYDLWHQICTTPAVRKIFVHVLGPWELPQVAMPHLALDFSGQPISSRGWIMQELLMSRRILYLTGDKFIWYCQSFYDLEDGLESYRRSRTTPSDCRPLRPSVSAVSMTDGRSASLPDRLSAAQEPVVIWLSWLLDYFDREFTFEQDSLFALAGLTDVFSDLTKSLSMVGLWKPRLATLMGWSGPVESRSELGKPPAACSHGEQPSWSWTSLPHPMRRHLKNSLELMRHQLREKLIIWEALIIDHDIRWDGRGMASRLLSSSITIGKVNIAEVEGQLDSYRRSESHTECDSEFSRCERCSLLKLQSSLPSYIEVPLYLTAATAAGLKLSLVCLALGKCSVAGDTHRSNITRSYHRLGLIVHEYFHRGWKWRYNMTADDWVDRRSGLKAALSSIPIERSILLV